MNNRALQRGGYGVGSCCWEGSTGWHQNQKKGSKKDVVNW